MEYTRLSERYLLKCRQLTSFVIDNELVQDVVRRLIEENTWVSNFWPRLETDNAQAMWKRSSGTVDEGLRCQLANLKISNRFARLCEDRARIEYLRNGLLQHYNQPVRGATVSRLTALVVVPCPGPAPDCIDSHQLVQHRGMGYLQGED
ncbi:MAG: hypothetical protein Q9185_001208 [Variospora sp. 1 TL-2023]